MSRSFLLAAVLLAVPAAAQGNLSVEYTSRPEHTCVLLAEPHEHQEASPTGEDLSALAQSWRATANPTSQTVVTHGPGATFVVTYTGFDPYPLAQAAYQSAVDIWANHLSSAVPIVVTAEFAPLGSGVLGSAGPFLVRSNSLPQANTWYPYAMADAVTGSDFVPGQPDLQSRFSSNFSNWYFGTDGNPPAGQFDFRTVVLHELGHGLGFSGSGRYDDGAGTAECDGVLGNGCWGRNGFTTPQIFDRFAEDAAGVPMLDVTTYPNPSTAMGALVRSSNVWIDTPNIAALPGGVRGRLWTPSTWQPGSSFSHWNEGAYPTGSTNALMTPQVAPGEHHDSPGPLTCAFFGDMGWPLGPGCATFVASESQPEEASQTLRLVGANPFTSRTELRLTLDAPQPVDAGLYDVTGRRVRTLFVGGAPAGATGLIVDASGLAAGVYTVRVVASAGSFAERLVLAR